MAERIVFSVVLAKMLRKPRIEGMAERVGHLRETLTAFAAAAPPLVASLRDSLIRRPSRSSPQVSEGWRREWEAFAAFSRYWRLFAVSCQRLPILPVTTNLPLPLFASACRG